MFVIATAAILAAGGSCLFVMWVAGKHKELGLATLVASMAFVSLVARYAYTGAEYDLFYLFFILSMTACAVITLITRALKKRH